jgi:hypothetical protein
LLLGFYESLGDFTSFHAELVGLYRGLFLTWEFGYRDVVCHSDSLLAVGAGEFHLYAALIQSIKELLSRNWICRFEHAYRESNFCANTLAKLASGGVFPLTVIHSPIPQLSSLLLADRVGVVHFISLPS